MAIFNSMWHSGILLWIYFSASLAVLNKNKPQMLRLSVIPDDYFDQNDILPIPETRSHDPVQHQQYNDPCEVNIPLRPTFVSDASRISERKCTEYLSEMVNREILREREERCQNKNNGNTRITISKKHSTKEGEYPHMAAVGWRVLRKKRWVYFCGGTLISSNFVLTAAHCSLQPHYRNIQEKPDMVRLGTRNIQKRFNAATDIKIKQFILHPSWDPPIRYYDIALIELATAVHFSKFIQPACLSGRYLREHTATVTGWGATEQSSDALSPVLQFAQVDIIDYNHCKDLLKMYSNRNWRGLKDHQICAGKIEGGVDTCKGDSGGPLQIKLQATKHEGTMHVVIGVTSFGFKCGIKGVPGIYTRVSSFLDWIESIVWP